MKAKGIVYTIISAAIFGATPILAKFVFLGGGTVVTLSFFRAVIPIPVLFLILKIQKIPFAVSKSILVKIAVLSLFGSSATILLLYAAYSLMPVGMAATIHFIFPVLVTIASVVVYKDRINMAKILALTLSTAGVLLFFNGETGGSVLGIVFALTSGVTYAFYILFSAKAKLKELNVFKLTFYMCLFNTVIIATYGLITRQLVFKLSSEAWVYAVVVCLSCTVGAVTLLQAGIKHIKPSTSAILCTFEPITSVILGALIFHETFDIKSAIGCVLVLLSALILSLRG